MSSPQQILLGLLALGNINHRSQGSRKVVAELASALGDCNTFDFFFWTYTAAGPGGAVPIRRGAWAPSVCVWGKGAGTLVREGGQ